MRKSTAGQPKLRLSRRLLSGDLDLLDVVDVVGECWVWRYGRTNGYGVIWDHRVGRPVPASRFVLGVSLGRVLRPDEDALHSCDNPPCVRLSHLRSGTPSENILDAVERGRWGGAIGVKHHSARLTPEMVVGLRADRASGMLYRELSAKYGVNMSNICKVLQGRSWRSVS